MEVMDPTVVGFNWLDSGGTYAILAVIWIASAVAFGNYAHRLGRRYDSPNDGCLLTVATQLLTLFGGALGLLLGRFPIFIFTSAIGAVIFPAAGCVYFGWRMRAYRNR